MEVTVTQILLKVRGAVWGIQNISIMSRTLLQGMMNNVQRLGLRLSTGDYRPLNQENIDIGESKYRNGSLSIHVTVFTTFIYDIYGMIIIL